MPRPCVPPPVPHAPPLGAPLRLYAAGSALTCEPADRPAGALGLPKVRAYARAYRRAAGATPARLATAVRRVWWERLNDFWMLRRHYERGDTRADPRFPAASALALCWTREYDAVCDAFVA